MCFQRDRETIDRVSSARVGGFQCAGTFTECLAQSCCVWREIYISVVASRSARVPRTFSALFAVNLICTAQSLVERSRARFVSSVCVPRVFVCVFIGSRTRSRTSATNIIIIIAIRSSGSSSSRSPFSVRVACAFWLFFGSETVRDHLSRLIPPRGEIRSRPLASKRAPDRSSDRAKHIELHITYARRH